MELIVISLFIGGGIKGVFIFMPLGVLLRRSSEDNCSFSSSIAQIRCWHVFDVCLLVFMFTHYVVVVVLDMI